MPNDSVGNEIAISESTSTALGLKLGDKVFCHFLNNNRLRSRAATVCGIYNTHFSEFDSRIAIVPSEMLRNIFRVKDNVGTSIEISGLKVEDIDQKTIELYNALEKYSSENGLNYIYQVENVLQSGAMYFSSHWRCFGFYTHIRSFHYRAPQRFGHRPFQSAGSDQFSDSRYIYPHCPESSDFRTSDR